MQAPKKKTVVDPTLPTTAGNLDAVRFWRMMALVTSVVAVALLIVALRLWPKAGTGPMANVNASINNSAAEPGRTLSLKRWGRLVTETIVFERPARLIVPVDSYFAPAAPWLFTDISAEDLAALFSLPALTEHQKSWLTDRSNWRPQTNGIAVQPPTVLVMGLSPEVRAEIYGVLARSPENRYQFAPFCIATNRMANWLDDPGISGATRELVAPLVYRRNTLACFSDPGLVADRIPVAERQPLIEALSRIPVQRAYLRFEPGEDLSVVSGYWGSAGGVEAYLPLLQALTHSPYGGQLDINFLLPRFARQLLYTYPDPKVNGLAYTEDCFWTAFNFFRYPPEPRFKDPVWRQQYMMESCDLVTTEPVLGDIYVLVNQAEQPIHACVYLAGNLVFTKNGLSVYAPWVLMSYPDLLQYYSVNGTPGLRVYRDRNPMSKRVR